MLHVMKEDGMLTVDTNDLQTVLEVFGIREKIVGMEELLRYDYEKNPAGKNVRLMLKCLFADREPVVVKLKHEDDVTETLLAEQIHFSEPLAACGIQTARFRRAGDSYVICRTVHDYEVLITVEEFRSGEITVVTPEIAEQTGRLLGMSHGIAERDNCHVHGAVLFDFFGRNDLFSYERFQEQRERMEEENIQLYRQVEAAYRRRMDVLAPLRERERYAVQGDISDCNLFVTENGEIGLFDFNRCGDNILFCDAVMQGVFESRLMDYDRELTEAYSEELFTRFLQGYHSVKPFSDTEISMIPHMYAVITAFWMERDGILPLNQIAERIERNLRIDL